MEKEIVDGSEEAIKLASNQTKNRRQYDLRYVSTCADKRP